MMQQPQKMGLTGKKRRTTIANFLHHGPCNKCGSRDNKAHYDDGSTFCFGCHDSSKRTHIPKAKEKEDDGEGVLTLPDDLCFDFPQHVIEWLKKYDITIEEAIKHGWKYSPYWDQLTFIFVDGEGAVTCSQARNFRQPIKRKYYNQGSPKDVLPIFYSPQSVRKVLVVVEDAVSAARIARLSDAMPCLGSYLPARKLVALKCLGYEHLVVWLDSDKLNEAREIAQMGKWIGFNTKVVYTELDPKEYSDKEISEYLQST